MSAEEKNKKADEGEEASDEATGAVPETSGQDAAENPEKEGVGGDDKASDDEDDAPAAGHLGAARYVMAGFFVTCIAAAYVLGRVLSTIWGKLAEASWFQKSVAVMARVGEEERSEIATVIGAVIALGGGLYAYRRPDVRQWTDDVASELSKVTWPDKNEVTNSTIIVIVTSTFATLYLALLDRFWGFVTNLVYGS